MRPGSLIFTTAAAASLAACSTQQGAGGEAVGQPSAVEGNIVTNNSQSQPGGNEVVPKAPGRSPPPEQPVVNPNEPVPSPYQPPAEVDPVREEVGNEGPGA